MSSCLAEVLGAPPKQLQNLISRRHNKTSGFKDDEINASTDPVIGINLKLIFLLISYLDIQFWLVIKVIYKI